MVEDMKLPNVKKPCGNCPFRKDSMKGWLGRDRMTQITSDTSFTCHKTTSPRLQCAGHMLLLGDNNDFVALAKAQNIKLQLTGRELVFDTIEDCIEHHD